ncbi:hypothetical protein Zmor_001127 [Zophobas morio]|uniref:Uncharacterized protein n=1 Tax=Zophobas morio TaxID=2755281 RepID=A0AA38IYN4_9CUCU|nr:hypothetical protein Zmor_001127 [Zophobas morio]
MALVVTSVPLCLLDKHGVSWVRSGCPYNVLKIFVTTLPIESQIKMAFQHFPSSQRRHSDLDYFMVISDCHESLSTGFILHCKRIYSLSLQMCHEKVAISVCGLFTIDYKLLFSMIASVATHLVLLLQIHQTYLK